MDEPDTGISPKVVLLFTTFPVHSETFLQREVEALREQGLQMRLVSLWGGDASWRGIEVEKAGLVSALGGILWLPWWLFARPRFLFQLLAMIWRPRGSGLLNWLENLLGVGYALGSARRWEQHGTTHFHAVWASAPAMAGWVLSGLGKAPFSFGGHAYDLFERGGDGWLREKATAAAWVRTSSEAGRKRLIEKGVDPGKVYLVRRGLLRLPDSHHGRPFGSPCRMVSVGRMVEKMGFDRQIPLLASLKAQGVSFAMDWIGDGPERLRLEKAVARAGLSGQVRFRGRLPYASVEEYYRSGDVFLFTGRVDRRGDRAGLPNAVAEAMAWGLFVFATQVGGVSEAIETGRTGHLWQGEPDPGDVLRILGDSPAGTACRCEARRWIENLFDLRQNITPLVRLLSTVTFCRPMG